MSKTQSLTYCSLFTALIAAGAFIKIPVPVVPFTLQFLFTTLAGLLLGAKRGFISVAAYMVLGLAGLPIFSAGGGFWYIFQPSFGYIIGFCIGTFVTRPNGRTDERKNRIPLSDGQLYWFADCLRGRHDLLLYHLQLCYQYANCPGTAVSLLLCAGCPR